MPSVAQVLQFVEDLAPPRYAFSFDHIGLQTGDPSAAVTGILTTLDCTLETLELAQSQGSNVVVSHHPLIWEPLASVVTSDPKGAVVASALQKGIAVIAAHTNWDCAPGGVNDTLARVLGLVDVRPFGSSSDLGSYKLVVFSPLEASGGLLDSLAEAGCGNIGLYERCAFTSEGQGTFRGKEGSHPVVGQPGRTESVHESRIEVTVPKASLERSIEAVRRAHPYEEPAFDFYPLQGGNGHPIGRIGTFPSPLRWDEVASVLNSRLGTTCMVWPGPAKEVQGVAVVGGAADDEWQNAAREGADLFLTGEIRHHISVEGPRNGIGLASAGHFATEHPGMVAMRDALICRLPGVPCEVFEPQPGTSGRPV